MNQDSSMAIQNMLDPITPKAASIKLNPTKLVLPGRKVQVIYFSLIRHKCSNQVYIQDIFISLVTSHTLTRNVFSHQQNLCAPLPLLGDSEISWSSYIKLGSYESVLICIKAKSYKLKRDYMDIEALHYLQVAKSILWTVIGCWPSEWVY